MTKIFDVILPNDLNEHGENGPIDFIFLVLEYAEENLNSTLKEFAAK